LNLDWHIFSVHGYRYSKWLVDGLWITLKISAISMVIALVLGTLLGVGRLSRNRLTRNICAPIIEFFRNTPLIIQLFFWYFGADFVFQFLMYLAGFLDVLSGPLSHFLVAKIDGLRLYYNRGESEFFSGIVGLSIYTAAFIAEVVRAGIQSIPPGQLESARSTGLSTIQALRYVILPQAFRIIVPPLITQFLNLMKNSSQAMAIGVMELTYMARQVEAFTFRGFEAFTAATLIYLVMSLIISFVLNRYDSYVSIESMAKRQQKKAQLLSEPAG
jgi:polar amino acid transport system permease protein